MVFVRIKKELHLSQALLNSHTFVHFLYKPVNMRIFFLCLLLSFSSLLKAQKQDKDETDEASDYRATPDIGFWLKYNFLLPYPCDASAEVQFSKQKSMEICVADARGTSFPGTAPINWGFEPYNVSAGAFFRLNYRYYFDEIYDEEESFFLGPSVRYGYVNWSEQSVEPYGGFDNAWRAYTNYFHKRPGMQKYNDNNFVSLTSTDHGKVYSIGGVFGKKFIFHDYICVDMYGGIGFSSWNIATHISKLNNQGAITRTNDKAVDLTEHYNVTIADLFISLRFGGFIGKRGNF